MSHVYTAADVAAAKRLWTDPWQTRKQKRAAKQMADLRIAADAWNARQAWLRRVKEIARRGNRCALRTRTDRRDLRLLGEPMNAVENDSVPTRGKGLPGRPQPTPKKLDRDEAS